MEEEDSFDDVKLPMVAWSSSGESGDESPDPQPSAVTEPTDHLLSPPPTELSDTLETPPQPLRRPGRNVVMSEDEQTPEPTLPVAAADVETVTPPNRRRGRPKCTPEVLLTRRRPRQLATPGPSDSATPGTSDSGTPGLTPTPELRKSTRLRRPRSLVT